MSSSCTGPYLSIPHIPPKPIPILMITYNRLEYTQMALPALLFGEGIEVYVIDNGSTDGTVAWLEECLEGFDEPPFHLTLNHANEGIAGAMNQFLEMTHGAEFVGKVDNDTIVPADWALKLVRHMDKVDIVQAKHPILKATHPDGFDAWVSGMPADGPLRFNHFVGGSGIIFRRAIVSKVPGTEWVLGGWRQFQRENQLLLKAFATDVEIELLDTNEGGADYSQYPDYYRETKRL